jgi:hypothetical protein
VHGGSIWLDANATSGDHPFFTSAEWTSTVVDFFMYQDAPAQSLPRVLHTAG